MKTKFSAELRDMSYYDHLPKDVENALLEAADTLEHHENETEKLINRLKTADARYRNLYENRQQLIKDFRVALLLSNTISITITCLLFYFL